MAEAEQATNAEVAKAITAQAAEHQAEVEFAESQNRAALEKVKNEAEETEASIRAEMEKLRTAITEAEQSAQTDRERLKQELEDEKASSAELVGGMQERLDAQQNDMETLSAQLDETRAKLEDTNALLGAKRRELEERRDAERRASQALAVALKVLDEPS